MCESIDGCHGPQSAPPGFGSPASATLDRAGQQKAAPPPGKEKAQAQGQKAPAQGQASGPQDTGGQADERKENRTVLFALWLLGLHTGAASASQAEEAAWKISSVSLPTNFAPESEGTIFLVANNLGAKATEGQITCHRRRA